MLLRHAESERYSAEAGNAHGIRQAALREATYEILDDGEDKFYREIPPLRGVWATGPTLEACREELREVVEAWILVRLAHQLALPVIAGIDINVKHAV